MTTMVENPWDTQPPAPPAAPAAPAAAPTPAPAPGLIDGAMAQPPAPAAAAPAPNPYFTEQAGTRNPMAKTMSTSGQVESILAKGGPTMRRARAIAQQAAAGRGLINSSMAAEAGTGAMIDRAGALAESDANAWNTASRQATDMDFTQGQNDAARTFAASESAAQRGANFELQSRDQGFQGIQAELNRTFQERLQQLQETGLNYRQANDIASQERQQSMQEAGLTSRQQAQFGFEGVQAEMNRNLTVSEQAAQRALQERIAQLQEGGASSRQAMEIASRESMQASSQAFQGSESAADRDARMKAQLTDQTYQADQADKNRLLQDQLTRLEESGNQHRFDLQLAQQGKQFDVEQAAADRRLAQQQSNALEQMGYANNLSRADVPAQYAAQVSSQTMQAINAIMGDPNLASYARQPAIENIINIANANLSWAEKFWGTRMVPIGMPTDNRLVPASNGVEPNWVEPPRAGAPAPAPAVAPQDDFRQWPGIGIPDYRRSDDPIVNGDPRGG